MSDNFSSLNPDEFAKFNQSSSLWWDEKRGEFAMLHRLNPLRIDYILTILQVYGVLSPGEVPLNSELRPDLGALRILDLGCGGGILSLPLARLGGKVVGIDASHNALQQAKNEAFNQGLQVEFKCGTLEELLFKQDADLLDETFDVIAIMELIEHVNEPEVMLQSCLKLLKPGGFLFLSTINRTIKAYLQAIIAAEYVLRWLPRGTHQWSKFFQPAEIVAMLGEKATLLDVKGINYSLIRRAWYLDVEDYACNFIATFRKK